MEKNSTDLMPEHAPIFRVEDGWLVRGRLKKKYEKSIGNSKAAAESANKPWNADGKPGQCVGNANALEGDSESAVETGLKWLTKRGMITGTKTGVGLLITVTNHEKYQNQENYDTDVVDLVEGE